MDSVAHGIMDWFEDDSMIAILPNLPLFRSLTHAKTIEPNELAARLQNQNPNRLKRHPSYRLKRHPSFRLKRNQSFRLKKGLGRSGNGKSIFIRIGRQSM